MAFIIKLTGFYLNALSFILPKYSGKKAFKIFQEVRLKAIKKREESYYLKATKFSVPLEGEDLKCYEFGSENKKTVFLIHGWQSNAGSLTLFANELQKQNYRVIGFDLPGHATNKEYHTNLYKSKIAFVKLIKQLNPQEPFSIVSHSFGSGVTAYALSELKEYTVDKVVFLSSTNKFIDIFIDYKKMLDFNERVFSQFKKLVEVYLGEKMDEIVVSKKMKRAKFNKLLIIHDKFDKVIPFKNALEVHNEISNSTLISFEKIGHYRMLWNDEVVAETVKFIGVDSN
ncbi:MAG: alpha/beta hydrolase [Flavobacteriaceae bacterium]|nr:alpha/beta hydrolase [Flavobacteriaceae bacterium]